MTKEQVRMLKFAIDYRGWHTYSKDQDTYRTIKSLVKRGLLETNEFWQFRLTTKEGKL